MFLCSGPLDGWVLPVTLAAASLLVLIGLWRAYQHRSN
jgi:hypothetical protein